jgi:hypothetical protein
LKRGRAVKQPYDRVLVVCEGAKTEPNYLHEIRQAERLASAYVKIIPSELGTDPLNIVESAIAEFERSRAFDKVYVGFDRDNHFGYANAIARAQAKDKTLKNDEKKAVGFEAVVSVPSFELWLLLHFHDQQAWVHRDDALQRLRQFIPGYEKGMDDTFARTKAYLDVATTRGANLKTRNSRLPGDEAYTDVHELVAALLKLRTQGTQ